MSESDSKFLKNKTVFLKKTNINQGAYKFEIIIDPHYNNFYFNENSAKKLYFELEVFLKGSFIRNWDQLLKNVSFNSIDYDFFLNLKNTFSSFKQIAKDSNLKKIQEDFNKMEIENEFTEEKSFPNKNKQEFIEKHIHENYSLKKTKSYFNLPAVFIIIKYL